MLNKLSKQAFIDAKNREKLDGADTWSLFCDIESELHELEGAIIDSKRGSNPGTIEQELVDVVKTCLTFAHYMDIDLDKEYGINTVYNQNRED